MPCQILDGRLSCNWDYQDRVRSTRPFVGFIVHKGSYAKREKDPYGQYQTYQEAWDSLVRLWRQGHKAWTEVLT